VKRSVSVLVLLLLVFVILFSFAQIETVKAIGLVYIRSDGSIEGAGLNLEDGVYVFTGDIYGQIVIQKDGVTVDGSEYVLYGMGEGGIFLENSCDVVLRNIKVVDAPFGITMLNGSNNIITGSNCSIKLENSFNNTISGNERISLLFNNSSKNIVTENNLSDNTGYGFKLQSTSNENNIFGNNITDSIGGIEFHGNSSYNMVHENWIVNNADGIIFYYSDNNSIHDNVIAFNSNSGIFLKGSSQNSFFRNDIVDNDEQVMCMWGTNIWDNGSEGNYWGDYNGTDNNDDGIGDEPYHIFTYQIESGVDYDVDNYPLIEPLMIPEFPSWTLLLVMLVVVLVVVVVYRRALGKHNEWRIGHCRSGSGACGNLVNCILQKSGSGRH
jgi:parallel beta-helix repeat protein